MILDSVKGSGLAKAGELVAPILIAVGATLGCGGSVTVDDSVLCGPGTAQEGRLCVADHVSSGGALGGPTVASGAGGGTDGAVGTASTAAGAISSVAGGNGGSFNAGSTTAAGTSSAGGGTPGAGGSTLIPIGGGLQAILIDPTGAHVYVSNRTQNRIEDYVIADGALKAPIPVGSLPSGFDITPDGSQMYVANTGGTNISVVDLATRQEVRKINVPGGSVADDTPFSLAMASNGKALFSTTFGGTGFGGRMMSLDLGSDAVTEVADFFVNGTTTEATLLKASADHSTVASIAGDISSGPVFLYRAATGAFSPEHDLDGFVDDVAVNADGTLVMVNGMFVLDGSLDLQGTIPPPDSSSGYYYAMGGAFAPNGPVAYRATPSGTVEILNVSEFAVTGSIPLADTLGGYGDSRVGAMAGSPDGKFLAVITDNGITLVKVP